MSTVIQKILYDFLKCVSKIWALGGAKRTFKPVFGSWLSLRAGWSPMFIMNIKLLRKHKTQLQDAIL